MYHYDNDYDNHATLIAKLLIIIIMVKSFAINARFERPQTCLLELVILQ